MKRLIFCFDGTWNKLNTDTVTNVVLTAASIQRQTKQNIPQLIHYDEGVGTTRLTHFWGGVFGFGLMQNVREAYRFLIFNYDPGDEIFVFGFSRGAYSARSFVGLLRCVGPLRRLHVGRIDEAIALYRSRQLEDSSKELSLFRFRANYSDNVCVNDVDNEWRFKNIEGYEKGSVPILKIKYLGVWDTVGALGVPKILPGSRWINRKLKFHDMRIDSFIEYMRHAVALDERRKLFPPELFSRVELRSLNEAAGHSTETKDAPYQERWFPGVHGSVGGGGDIRGLSDGALQWILKGAQKAGLILDTEKGTRIHGFQPDPLASLNNVRGAKPFPDSVLRAWRDGPDGVGQVSESTKFRWYAAQQEIEDGLYRPESLSKIANDLSGTTPVKFEAPTDLITIRTVAVKDNLSGYAREYYGKASLWTIIFEANRDVLYDPDDLFPGQKIRIPHNYEELRSSGDASVSGTSAGSEAPD